MSSGKTSPSAIFVLVCIFVALIGAGGVLLASHRDNNGTIKPSASSSSSAAPAQSSDKDSNGCYTSDTVRNHYGENACVDFTVGYTHETSAGTKFIDEKQDYTAGIVGYVAYNSPANGIDLSSLNGKNVKITGTIQKYNGYPEIVITSLDQVATYN